MNISDHVSDLRKWMILKKYSESTVNGYCSNFRTFLTHFEKQWVTHPDRINAKMIIEFLSKFQEPATHSAYHSAIKMYYSKVAHVGIEKFKHIERPRRSQKLPIVLSQAEIQKMFDVCQNTKHKVILSLLYSAGLRVSELVNLKWEHLNRDQKIINIIQGKGKKDRHAPLSDLIIPLLERYYYEYHSKVYILNGQGKLTYSHESVLQVVKQLANKAGIKKDVWTHLIRHCTFTHLLESKTELALIQRLAGHSDIKTTMRYCHISPNLISQMGSPIGNIRL